MQHFDREIDLSGLNCPMPILRTKAEFAKMEQGDIIKIVVTHPESLKEFPTFAKQMGHQLVDLIERDDEYIYYIKKG